MAKQKIGKQSKHSFGEGKHLKKKQIKAKQKGLHSLRKHKRAERITAQKLNKGDI
jgi:hypothetical protein